MLLILVRNICLTDIDGLLRRIVVIEEYSSS